MYKRQASGSNFKAEYLYDELAKRKIPAVIMEPLLGGRLSNVPDHIAVSYTHLTVYVDLLPF